MFAELTGMTQGASCFMTLDRRHVVKRIDDGDARVAEAVMPEGGRNGEAASSGGGGRNRGDGVEVAAAIAAKNHASRP